MSDPTMACRDHLVRVLDWGEAHVTFDTAVGGIAPDRLDARADGFEHTLWQLVEHIRIAQADILDFCINPAYTHTMTWPDDYWPADAAKATPQSWIASLAAYGRDREAVKRLARDVPDLTARVPTGNETQTYLRAILLVADHAAYHVGQIVALRKALGLWPVA